jgi:glycosyltransferase involved in cell wall biosynthesis
VENNNHITILNINNSIKAISQAIKIIWNIGIIFIVKNLIEILRQEGISAAIYYFKSGAAKLLRRAMGNGNYERWIRLHDSLSADDIAEMKEQISLWNTRPLISIIMPTHNSNLNFLSAAINSVINQIYMDWELCIADDASTDLQVFELLEHYQKKDRRIKVVRREKNGHISAASNTALEIAQGEWIAFLDHDDLLAPGALFWVAQATNKSPNIQIIYSDEDKVDSSGKRFDPYFKPDWNRDLFYSQNYLCHLGVYRKQLIDLIDGLRLGFEGAQDYDLTLRCIERVDPKNIHHISRLLYHWRSHPHSTAQSIHAKEYALDAGKRALNEHFERLGIDGHVEVAVGGYRAHYRLPEKLPLVSLVIPTRNSHNLVRRCIEKIIDKTTYQNYEIVLADNGSTDPDSLKYFSQLEKNGIIKIIKYPFEFNYSAINNFVVERVGGEIIGLINNDIEVITPEWLTEMVSHALQQDVGAVGAKLLFKDDTVQHAGVVVGIGGVAGHTMKGIGSNESGYFCRAQLVSSYSAVTAACLIVRKSVYLEVGGLNENELKVSFNDVDFCLKLAELGYRNVWTPYAQLYHHESVSRGGENTRLKMERFKGEIQYMKSRWSAYIHADPAYNPNLTVDCEDHSISWSPRM